MTNTTTIDSKQFRKALGSFTTGVTVVTTRGAEGGDVGLTADVGKVARRLHSQLTAEVVVGIKAGVPRLGTETGAEAIPTLIKATAQGGDRLGRQSPPSRIPQIAGRFGMINIPRFLPKTFLG